MQPQHLFSLRTLTAVAAVIALAQTPIALAHTDQKSPQSRIDYSKAEETAFGKAADPRKAARTIHVDMSDRMRFSPAAITVKQGEIVRFAVKNSGKIMHEMVIGTMDELKTHLELMKKHPGMEHDEPHMAHVPPGKTQNLGWQFTKAGEFHFGCLIPGHFEAGMVGKITVTAAPTRPTK